MYIPQAFAETRLPVLHQLIEAHPFCSLITMGPTGLLASHIPMVLHVSDAMALRTGEGPLGTLHGHVSRANHQWRDFDPGVEALAIFAGPQHYVSPGWYPEKQEHGKVVPTWNYAVVHVYGTLRAIDEADKEPEWLLAHLRELTDKHEGTMPQPWKVSDAPPEYIRTMTRGIVGLELSIARIEGKWKASQNRSERDRRGVIAGLASLGDEESSAMSELVRERLDESGGK